MYQYGSDEDDIQLSTDDFDGYGEVEAGAGFQDRDWWVAVKDLRPWAPFSDNSVWPAFPVAEFKTGDRVVYTEGGDSSTRWNAYVQRVFVDGLWLYVEGSGDLKAWNTYEHHCLVCSDTLPGTANPNSKLDTRQHIPWGGGQVEKRMLSMNRHLRKDREFDAVAGRWNDAPPRQKFFCKALTAADKVNDDQSIRFYSLNTYTHAVNPVLGAQTQEQRDTGPEGDPAGPEGDPAAAQALALARVLDDGTVRNIVRAQGMLDRWPNLPQGDTALRDIVECAVCTAVQHRLQPHPALQPCQDLLGALDQEVDEILISARTMHSL